MNRLSRLSRLALPRRHARVLASHKLAGTALLVGGLLVAPAAAWAVPVALPAVQEEPPAAVNAPQVIAQGIARLPQGPLGWTLQRVDVTGDSATPVAAFPLGFILSDNASVVVLTENDEALGVLEYGEAIFLDGGPGGIAPWRDDAASLYELALIPQEAAEGTTATVIGDFFEAPEGRGFEIELARGELGNGMESTVPASRSGAPTLLLQTSGAAELVAENGEPVTMTAGQFALLSGAITVRGAGSEPSTFVVASIGEPAPVRGGDQTAADAGANRANRANRANTNTGGGSSGGNTGGGGGGSGRGNQQSAPAADSGGSSAPSTDSSAESEDRAADRAARQAERAARQGAAGTPTPVTETGTESDGAATDAGTPTPVEEEIATPDDAATDDAEEIIVDQDFNNNNNNDDDNDAPNVIEVTEPTPTPTPIPPADQAPPAEETTPPDGTTPAEETPGEAPAAEVPGETPAEEVPGETPVEQVPAEEAPPADPAAEGVAPVEEAPAVEEVPAEAAPVDEVPVEQVPANAPAADPAADPAAQG